LIIFNEHSSTYPTLQGLRCSSGGLPGGCAGGDVMGYHCVRGPCYLHPEGGPL